MLSVLIFAHMRSRDHHAALVGQAPRDLTGVSLASQLGVRWLHPANKSGNARL